MLGATAPSLYDLRNLFQVNVEEGRHLWAMVYLLHTYFGRDGREEAEELLQRRSRRRRQAAHPRRVQRADEPLARLLHVHDVHRPRRQDQLNVARRERLRSARAHVPLHAHRRSAPHVRRRDGRRSASSSDRGADEEPVKGRARAGGVDLPTIQKYLNLWYTLSLDLFGGEVSSNAADAFAAGLKGRFKEDRYDEQS